MTARKLTPAQKAAIKRNAVAAEETGDIMDVAQKDTIDMPDDVDLSDGADMKEAFPIFDKTRSFLKERTLNGVNFLQNNIIYDAAGKGIRRVKGIVTN